VAQHFKAVAAEIWVAKIIAAAAETWVAVDLVRAAVGLVKVVVVTEVVVGLVAKVDSVIATMACN
jgi:hypothetical protein